MKQILKLTLLLLALLLPATAVANPITLQQAQQNALSFLQEKGKSITISSLRHAQLRSGSTIPESYYVFNIGSNEGYVITAGDDCAPAILGYAESGYIDVDSIPDNLKGWLEEYAQQIQFMRENGYSPSKAPKLTSSYSAISPLLTTTWDQLDPYNQNCPDFFSYGKCVTGCVATAMAQVMYYHRARSVTQTTAQIPAYTCRHRWISGTDTLQIHVDAIPAGSPIDWDNMLNSYGSSATTTQEQAVANLMKYCGASVQMDYANEWNGGSGAYSTDVPTALKTYFNYSSETVLKNRSSYSTNDAWESLIYNELSNSRPVYYSGRNSSGGHAFVCDGYDGSGYYHINWGWSGTSDGYFLLTALDPNEQGTGGSSSGYNQSQAALIYAEPKSSSPSNPVLATSISLNKTSAEINTGGTLQLTATVLPSNATNKTVAWSTSNSSVATVNSDGLVTALSPGTATITVMTTDGTNLSAYCSITVKQNSQDNIISFADANVKALCVQNWDTDRDGELSTSEAAAVTSLGSVFMSNKNITSFNELGYFSGLTSIGNRDFSGCSRLTSVTIPNSVTTIGGYAFSGCSRLTSVTIPNSVTTIGNYAFEGCSWLRSITIPSGVTSIGQGAFSSCSGLTYITVDSDNPVYDSRNNCNAIIEKSNNQLVVGCKNTIIPSSVTSIGYSAFKGCSGLTSVTIPNSVTTIGNGAFSVCSGLTSVTIPNSVTEIGSYAFMDCVELTSIDIPNSVTTIGYEAFNGTAWYNNQPYGLVYAGLVAYTYKGTMPENTHITLREGTLGIAGAAFYYCSGLTSINIPNSVTTIGYEAFNGTAWYNNQPDGLVYAGLVAYNYKGTMPENTHITLREGTLGITGDAFYYRSELTSIDIPNSVTTIGEFAFRYCSGLHDVYCYISDPSLVRVGYSAFDLDSQDYSARTLHVPMGTREAYQADTKWFPYFGSIVEMEANIFATSIALNNTVTELTEGENLQLIATILPENATNKTVLWATNNSSVATVDANGIVTAVAPGTATITATTTDGSNLCASCLVTVTEDVIDYDNYLSMDNLEAFHGDTIVIPVKMTNAVSIISFQTDIFLPEGLELLQEDGEYMIDPSERMTNTHSIISNAVSNGAIRVLCYSSNYKPFAGESGDNLFYLTVKVADDAEGDYAIQLRNTLLTTSDFEEIEAPDIAANVYVKSYLLGDANNSRTVTITDVVVTSQYVLEMNPQPFVFEAADVNFDGNITVTDVSRIAWMVLNPDEAKAPMRASVIMGCSDHMSGEGITLATGETRTVSIALDNEMDYTAFQMDLTLPEGLTASNFRLTDRAGSHAFDINTLANGKTRVLCYSPAIEVIDGHDGALLTFDVTAAGNMNGDIAVDGIELVTTDCKTVHPGAFTIGVNAATSINEIAGSKTVARVDYFNVAGQRVDSPDSGVTLVVTTYTDGTRTTTKVIR